MTPPTRHGPRTEWKVRLDPTRAAEVFAIGRQWMQPDAHVQDRESSSYKVESIYYDTPNLDCYRQGGVTGFPKYRARRYGAGSSTVFLEEKVRRGYQVWKRRIDFNESALGTLYEQSELSDQAEWFRSKIRMLDLRPIILVTYERRALIGAGGERFTIDHTIEARRYDDGVASFECGGTPHQILSDHVLEFKYTGEPTQLISDLHAALDMESMACSKYRLGIRAVGLDNGEAETP